MCKWNSRSNELKINKINILKLIQPYIVLLIILVWSIRYHKMGYFLKYWSKYWKLIGADNGYLSSYAFQLLIIAFLQAGLEKPILPNLLNFDRSKFNKTIYYLPRGSTDYVWEANCYFISNYDEHLEKMHNEFGK